MPANQQNLNDATPAAPSGRQNAKWQRDTSTPRNDSAYVPNTGGAAVKTVSYQLLSSDCGMLLVFEGTANGTFTLPSAPPFGQWDVFIQNASVTAGSPPVTPTLTITPLSGSPPAGANLDGSSASIVLQPGQGIYIASDGTNYFTERGAGSSGPSIVRENLSGTLNGSNTAFTSSYTPNPVSSQTVWLNGVEQIPTTDYTASGATVTFTVAPKSTDDPPVTQYTH